MHQDSFKDYDFEKIKEAFEKASLEVFDNDVEYSFFSGSVPYGGGRVGKSDIDIIIVLKEKEYPLSKFIEFGKHYIEINRKNNFIPDTVFFGEFLTPSLVLDAISGRGFSIDEKNALYLPLASEEYYLANSEAWLRAWLSMLTFSVFGTGSLLEFKVAKRMAWKTVLLFLFSNLKTPAIKLEDLIDLLSNGENKWIGFGVTKNYYLFESYEAQIIKEALLELTHEGFIKEIDGSYEPIQEAIGNWNNSIVEKIKDRSIRKAKLLIDMEEVREIAKSFRV